MITLRKTKNRKIIQKLNTRIFPTDPLELKYNSVCWLAHLNEMPVGFATLCPLTYEKDVVFFSRAGILPIARGQGIHKRLIKIRIQHCKKNNIKQAITYTLDGNYSSANNLTACGFKLYEPQNRWADSIHKKEVLYFIMEF